MPEPSVSPADTIRRYIENQPPQSFEAHPWKVDALTALDVLLAVGERDKARIKWLEGEERGWRTGTLVQTKLLGECNAARERDRQQIAQLTEAAENALEKIEYALETGTAWLTFKAAMTDAANYLRAVLADEEDADDA